MSPRRHTHLHRTVTVYELPTDQHEQIDYAIKRLGAYRRCVVCDAIGFKPYLDGPIRWLSEAKACALRELAAAYNQQLRELEARA